MKKTIANTNKYFTNAKSKEKMIVNSVYTSVKVEGSKTTKKELKEHYSFVISSSILIFKSSCIGS